MAKRVRQVIPIDLGSLEAELVHLRVPDNRLLAFISESEDLFNRPELLVQHLDNQFNCTATPFKSELVRPIEPSSSSSSSSPNGEMSTVTLGSRAEEETIEELLTKIQHLFLPTSLEKSSSTPTSPPSPFGNDEEDEERIREEGSGPSKSSEEKFSSSGADKPNLIDHWLLKLGMMLPKQGSEDETKESSTKIISNIIKQVYLAQERDQLRRVPTLSIVFPSSSLFPHSVLV
jgi:hypothetical protein